MKVFGFFAVACLFGAALADYEFGAREGKLKPTQFLKSYQGFVNDFYRKNDAYRMEYHVGDSARFEERTDSGEVKGTYAFVAPEGDEFEFKYEADDEGFKVEGDALPKVPEETEDVKAAREAFFEAYEKQLELAGDYDYDSDEYSDEDSDEDDDESSEESSEESDEDDSDEDDYDDEEESSRFQRLDRRNQPEPSRQTSFFTVPYPYRRRQQ